MYVCTYVRMYVCMYVCMYSGGQYRVLKYCGTVPWCYFSTITGTVGTWYQIPLPRYFVFFLASRAESITANSASVSCSIAAASKTMVPLHNSRVIGSFFFKYWDMFLFFVSIAVSKEFLDLQ